MKIVKYRRHQNTCVVSVDPKIAYQAGIKENEKVVVSYDQELHAVVVRGTGVIEPPLKRIRRRRRRRAYEEEEVDKGAKDVIIEPRGEGCPE